MFVISFTYTDQQGNVVAPSDAYYTYLGTKDAATIRLVRGARAQHKVGAAWVSLP